jgi:hypothetical protein
MNVSTLGLNYFLPSIRLLEFSWLVFVIQPSTMVGFQPL